MSNPESEFERLVAVAIKEQREITRERFDGKQVSDDDGTRRVICVVLEALPECGCFTHAESLTIEAMLDSILNEEGE